MEEGPVECTAIELMEGRFRDVKWFWRGGRRTNMHSTVRERAVEVEREGSELGDDLQHGKHFDLPQLRQALTKRVKRSDSPKHVECLYPVHHYRNEL